MAHCEPNGPFCPDCHCKARAAGSSAPACSPFRAGQQAYRDGVVVGDNPHADQGSFEHWEWMAGWADAGMEARRENAGTEARYSVASGALLGVLFRCADGHEWEAAVGGVWLQMPWCPECERTKGKRLPAVAWIGKWDTPNDKAQLRTK